MSFESRSNIDERSNQSHHAVVTSRRQDVHSEAGANYISTLVVNLRQLQTELHAQHQHDKQALSELNTLFGRFVNRVQQLQAENFKIRTAIADVRRQSSVVSLVDVQWDSGFLATRRDLLAIESAKVDCEWDFELCRLQIAIYKQLIEIEQQWEGKRILVLEDELKQSSSALASLRGSYGEMQRKVEGFYVECDDLFKQYLTLTNDWCITKKQRNKGHLSMETLKSSITFYKNLQSYSTYDFKSTSVQSGGVIHVQALDLDKIIKKIRADFQAFYATLYREMTASYEAKMVELEVDVKQALHQQSLEIEEFSMVIQTQQVEYEKVQKSLSYERETSMKLESACSKLEGDFNSIQLYHEEQYEAQGKELHSVQERIMFLAFDVDEIRRSKADLEAEIIVYRHLLEIYQIEHHVTVVPQAQTVVSESHSSGSETMGKLAVQSQRKGSIGIKECAPNGTYISLVNHSTSKDIDISKWKLKRHIDSVTKLRYTIPDGVRIRNGSELRIYTKSSGGSTAESSSYQRLVNSDLTSWGTGASIETILFNKNGDEEASYLQSIRFG